MPDLIDRRAEFLAGFYGRAADDINATLSDSIRRLTTEPESRQAAFLASRSALLQRQIDEHLVTLGRTGPTRMRGILSDAWSHGAESAVRQARALGFVPTEESQRRAMSLDFVQIDTESIGVLANDSATRMTRETRQHGGRAVSLLRTLSLDGVLRRRVSETGVNEAIARGLIAGDPRLIERNVRELFQDPDAPEAMSYRQLGNQQIGVGGWSGPLRVYVRTTAHTRSREAVTRGRHERLASVGIGLVQIVGTRTENFCTRFLNLVCALNHAVSEDGRYVLLSSLPGGGPPFHPNCRKNTRAYVAHLVKATNPERAADAMRARDRYETALEEGTLTDRVAG